MSWAVKTGGALRFPGNILNSIASAVYLKLWNRMSACMGTLAYWWTATLVSCDKRVENCPTSRAELGLEMRKRRAWSLIIFLPNQFACHVLALHVHVQHNNNLTFTAQRKGKSNPTKVSQRQHFFFFFWSLHWNERKQAQTTVSLRNNVFVSICCLYYYYVIIRHGWLQAKPDQS